MRNITPTMMISMRRETDSLLLERGVAILVELSVDYELLVAR
jgi:hypothetical protein